MQRVYENTWICLCFPSDIRNIGGAIRVVANFKLAGLKVITKPETIWSEDELKAYSSGAYQQIRFERYHYVAEATADADLLIGTSRRPRSHAHIQSFKSTDLMVVLGSSKRPHLLFGNERVGLSHAELDLCHALIEIHSDPSFPSLNLAHAVACLAYELTRSGSLDHQQDHKINTGDSEVKPIVTQTSTLEDEAFLKRVIEVCERTQFPPGKNAMTYARKLRSLLRRAQPTAGDYGIVLGLFRELDRLNLLAHSDSTPSSPLTSVERSKKNDMTHS